ncbi:hypothetical protein FA13DRAFT_647448 [Coprinellus micaceus]|uniref:Uncharacterized protein n=1 Tax=Coprinellus micaceus TaxID=71717 RepID=A0A4Y7T5S1_COPMI|nr:hypothetical protein FA13DRAFT_647448 [Coprinellus micaceus]
MIPVASCDQSTARAEHSESFLDPFAPSLHERGVGPTADRSIPYHGSYRLCFLRGLGPQWDPGIDYTRLNIQQAVAPKAQRDGYSNSKYSTVIFPSCLNLSLPDARISEASSQNLKYSTGLATTANRGSQNHLASDSGNLNQGSSATYRWEYAYSANGSYHYSLRLNANANTGQNGDPSYSYIRPENRHQTSDVEFAPTYRSKDTVYYTLKAANPTYSLGFTNDAEQASTSYHAAQPVCEVDYFAAPRAAGGGHGVPSNPTAAYTTASTDSGRHKFNLDDPALDWGAIGAFIARHGLESVTSPTDGAMGEYSAALTGSTQSPFGDPSAWGNSQYPLAVNNATPHHSAYPVQYSPAPANMSAVPSPADSIFSRGTNVTQTTTPAASPLVPVEVGNGSSVEKQQAPVTSTGESQPDKKTRKGKGTKGKGASNSIPKSKQKAKAASGRGSAPSSTSKAAASGSTSRVSKAVVPAPFPTDTVPPNFVAPSSAFTFTLTTPETPASADAAPAQRLFHSFAATPVAQADWNVQVGYNHSPPRGDKAAKMNARRLARPNFQMINPGE